mgnify:CR=1 FL=1
MGFNCHVSQFLKTYNLKVASYPFDWIMSDLNVVQKSIEDNFKDFLDKNLYVNLNRIDRCGHKTYCDNMFVHHNPLSNEQDYLYFNRCVDRFRDLFKKKRKKLFIISIINGEQGVGDNISEDLIQKFIAFNDFLKNHTSNFHLLIIINYPCKKSNRNRTTEINNLTIIELDTISYNTGREYKNDIDNKYLYDKILKLYKFKLKPIM